MTDNCRTAFDIIVNGIDVIQSTSEYLQVQHLIEDFVEKYNPPEIYKIFLECKLWNLENSFI